MSIRAWTFLATTLLLTGCLGTFTGRPERRGPRSIESRSRPDVASPGIWRQVIIGQPPTETLEGYLHTDGSGSHWVYDAEFLLIGRISPAGRTIRVTLRDGEKDLGSYALQHSMLRLFRHAKSTEVNLARMPPPRG